MAAPNSSGGWDLTDDDLAEVMAASFGPPGAAMTHDPMCPEPIPGFRRKCNWCNLIEEVRAAQREEDAQIVESLMPSDPDNEGGMYLYFEGEWVPPSLAAAAIREGK